MIRRPPCPDVPALRYHPVILLSEDEFTSPAPFRPDLAVACDEVIEQKIHAVMAHHSQFMEWLAYDGHWDDVLCARTPEEADQAVHDRLQRTFAEAVQRFPKAFPEGACFGEVFQVDEYGGKMTEEIRRAMCGPDPEE